MADITYGNLLSFFTGTSASAGGFGLGPVEKLHSEPGTVLIHIRERFTIHMPSPEEMKAGSHERAHLQLLAEYCFLLKYMHSG